MDFLDRQDIPDPAVQILNALESTTYHFVYDANVVRYDLVQCIIQAILRWADMLTTRLKVSVLYMLRFHSAFLTQLTRARLSSFPTPI